MVQQPNQGQVYQFNQQIPPDRTTQKPQLPLQVWTRLVQSVLQGDFRRGLRTSVYKVQNMQSQ